MADRAVEARRPGQEELVGQACGKQQKTVDARVDISRLVQLAEWEALAADADMDDWQRQIDADFDAAKREVVAERRQRQATPS
jgi:hypothetical protein